MRSVFKICNDYNWMYLIGFKEGSIKSIAAEFEAIREIEKKDKEIGDIYWVKDISYNDRKVNIIESITVEKEEEKRFVFVTDINITRRNAERIVVAGRSRWKIENEGFTKQKNLRYDIQHANSRDYNAMKNHYLLTQIADMMMQLYENGLKIFKSVNKTAKEISSGLLEAIRTCRLTDEDILRLANPTQIRFT